MRTTMWNDLQLRRCGEAALALLFVAGLAACGGGSTVADSNDAVVRTTTAGATPFVAHADIEGRLLDRLSAVRVRVDPKPGATASPVDVTYRSSYLARRGWLDSTDGDLRVPVVALHAGHRNQVSVALTFDDGSVETLPLQIDTAPYTDPNAIYDRPTIRDARLPAESLGFDYFYLKSLIGPPVIVDTDGEVRWVGTDVPTASASAWTDKGFVVGMPGLGLRRLELDGAVTDLGTVVAPTPVAYTGFHHNFDPGKTGLLVEVDATDSGTPVIESILVEVGPDGSVISEWNFESIFRRHMLRGGDDPNAFVRTGFDWFHMNAAIYDPRDDTILASSRENFVVKVDYSSGEIVWILGDTTKYWYTFPTLRAKSLTLAAGGLVPIGQHALSLLPGGELMLFNNGLNSLQQPSGAPRGDSRSYSAVSIYAIDAATMSATETARFDYGQTVLAAACSSVYQAPDGSLLVDYANADNFTRTRLVGLDPGRQVVFDFEYTNTGCDTAWNAEIVPLGQLTYD